MIEFNKLTNSPIYLYEDFVNKSEETFKNLFDYYGKNFDLEKVKICFKKHSKSTNNKSALKKNKNPTEFWKTEITEENLEKTRELLKIFKLDYLYNI